MASKLTSMGFRRPVTGTLIISLVAGFIVLVVMSTLMFGFEVSPAVSAVVAAISAGVSVLLTSILLIRIGV